ncbi:hypothetical protein [Pseudaestuariivita atlantica]|uniref:hypothetical protein n=1 Tax=Pseudaestuariivita atlantica TaxID=1317121 RepID=UPI00067B8D5B|nr:hypothetical protein [Pseudaestuariivita atlantica]
MTSFEYKVVPAPQRGQKARGVRGVEARFALAMERVMNEMAEGGWEYQRSDTLPCEERSALNGPTTTYQTMLIFRRARPDDVAAFRPRQLETPAQAPALPPLAEPAPAPVAEAKVTPVRPARADLSVVQDAPPVDEVKPAPAPEPKTKRSKATQRMSPALLERARQMAARAKSDVAAE